MGLLQNATEMSGCLRGSLVIRRGLGAQQLYGHYISSSSQPQFSNLFSFGPQ